MRQGRVYVVEAGIRVKKPRTGFPRVRWGPDPAFQDVSIRKRSKAGIESACQLLGPVSVPGVEENCGDACARLIENETIGSPIAAQFFRDECDIFPKTLGTPEHPIGRMLDCRVDAPYRHCGLGCRQRNASPF
jgi:hypothetical protein